MGYQSCAECLELETPAAGVELPEASSEFAFLDRKDLRTFLVACLQASVSVQTMSRYLGLDEAMVREELRLGIEAWNTGKRRASRTGASPALSIVASRD